MQHTTLSRVLSLDRDHWQEPLAIADQPADPTTKKWRAVVRSAGRDSTTTARRIFDAYAAMNHARLNGRELTHLIAEGHLKFVDPTLKMDQFGQVLRSQPIVVKTKNPRTRSFLSKTIRNVRAAMLTTIRAQRLARTATSAVKSMIDMD